MTVAAAPVTVDAFDSAPVVRSAEFSAAMLDVGKARWAREAEVTFAVPNADAGANLVEITAEEQESVTKGGSTQCPR